MDNTFIMVAVLSGVVIANIALGPRTLKGKPNSSVEIFFSLFMVGYIWYNVFWKPYRVS